MLIRINPQNPQERKLAEVVKCLKDGGVIIYPTDTLHIVSQNGPQLGYVMIDHVCVSVDPDGCPMAVGSKEPESVGSALYPNPARDRITLQGFDSGAVITIHDTMGRMLWHGTSTGADMRIAVGHLARGTYIVRAVDAVKQRSFKFVLIE